jgi:acyltransferase
MDKSRYAWVDTAKALGIFFIFYVHLVADVYQAGISQAFYQQKFIQAFIIPFFFFMTGFFWRPFTGLSDQIKKLVLRRLVPVFAFAVFSLPLWLIHYWNLYGELRFGEILWQAKNYLHGLPYLNFPIWFVICLFTCELFASLIFPKLRSRLLIFLFGAGAFFIGLVMYQHTPAIVRIFGVPEKTWYIYESIVPLGFFAMGYALFPLIRPLAELKPRILCVVCLLALGGTLLSYNMNNPSEHFLVMINCATTGKILPFVTTSVAGIVFMLSLSAVMSRSAILLFVGKHTLPLLGINGFFYHFVNDRVVALWLPDNTLFSITIYCTVFSLMFLAVSIPLAAIMDRFIPQLVGKSYMVGPLLPNLEGLNWAALTMKCAGRIMSLGRTIFRRHPDGN